jgi:hypothetical protein
MTDDAAASGEAPGGAPPSLAEALGWVGARLDEISGARVGWVDGVYVDAEDGSPQWLLVRRRRFGAYTLLPLEHAAAATGHVWVPYERAAIRAAPRVEPGSAIRREDELEICSHYRLPAGSGRAGELRERQPGSPTARPAASA